MDEIKVVIFDWDETLSDRIYLFPGAEELIKKLKNKGIRICILTARPVKYDVRVEIRQLLKKHEIELQEEDVMWTGQEVGQQDDVKNEVAGQNKANMIEAFAKKNKLKEDNILFVDDKKEYIAAVEKKGFRVKLVPQHLVGAFNRLPYISFYNSIESYISTENEKIAALKKEALEEDLLDKLYTALNGIDIDPFYSPSVEEIYLKQLKEDINKNDEKNLNKESFIKYLDTQYKRGMIKINDYTNLLHISSGLEDQASPAESISENTIVTMLLEIANKNDVWQTQGSAGLFGRKIPDGIDKIAKTEYLKSMIAYIKDKSSTFKYSLYTSLGVRSKMTDEFYKLILSLESVSKETQLKAINTFCDKWIPKEAMPPVNTVHLKF